MNATKTFAPQGQTGFTLTEAVIVMAIVAILFAVAIPSYNNSTYKTRRSEGRALLLEAAQIQERHFTEYGQYATQIIDSGTAEATKVVIDTNSVNNFYVLSSTNLTASSFTITAVPQNAQTSDSCGTLSLNNLGVKTPDGCW